MYEHLIGILPFIFLLGWTFYSVRYVRKALNDYSLINPIILDNIPTVFSTLGVFGTFLGISIALFGFNVNDIDGSIPELLNGLKVAFLSSILGIAGSWIFQQFFISTIQFKQTSKDAVVEGEELKLIATTLIDIKKSVASDKADSISSQLESFRSNIREKLKANNEFLENLVKEIVTIKMSLTGDEESSLNTQLIKLKNSFNDQLDPLNKTVNAINDALNSEKGIIVNLLKWQELQSVQHKEVLDKMQDSENKLEANKIWLEQKFEDFSDLLSKSNTEALVDVIEQVIGGFNDKLNELIEKLVKENFEQLNESRKS